MSYRRGYRDSRPSGRRSPVYQDPIVQPPSAGPQTPPPPITVTVGPPPAAAPLLHETPQQYGSYRRDAGDYNDQYGGYRGRDGRSGGGGSYRSYSSDAPPSGPYPPRQSGPYPPPHGQQPYQKRRNRDEFERDEREDEYRAIAPQDQYRPADDGGRDYVKRRRYDEEEADYRRPRRDYQDRDRYDSGYRGRDKQEHAPRAQAQLAEPADDEMGQGDILDEYRSLIISIGDNGPKHHTSQLNGLVKAMSADVETYAEQISDIILECVSTLPLKTSVYGTLVALLNDQHPNKIGAHLLDKTLGKLEEYLARGDFTRSKLLIRFLGEICNAKMISSDSWLDLASQLLAAANPEWQPLVADQYVYLVMASLPWVARTISTDAAHRLRDIMSSIDSLTSGRPSSQTRKVFERLRDSRWTAVACLPKTSAAFEKQLERQKRHTLRELVVKKVATLIIPTKADLEMDPLPASQMPTLDQFCLLEQCSDVLYFFNSDRSLCVKQLSYLVDFYGDQYKTSSPDAISSAPVEHMIVQSVFAHMFMQPTSPLLTTYYALLMIEFVSLLQNKQNFTIELAQQIDWVFENADKIDAESRRRFAELFALQMNHFQFKWDWESLQPIADLEPSDPKYQCLQLCLHKIEQLCFISTTADETFRQIRAKMIGDDRAPNYQNSKEARDLLAALRTGDSARKSILGTPSFTNVSGPGDVIQVDQILSVMPNEEERLSALVNVVLLHNMRSAHDLTLSLQMPSIRKHLFFPGDLDRQKKIVSLAASFWKNSIQRLRTVLDAMQGEGILTGRAIIEWVLLDQQVREDLHQPHYWEILSAAVDKVVQQARAVHINIQRKSKKLAELTNGAASEQADDATQPSSQKKEDIQKHIEELEATFTRLAGDISDVCQALLSSFGTLLSQQQQDEKWSSIASDNCTLLLNTYLKVMKEDIISSAIEPKLATAVSAARYYSQWDTLAHLPSNDDSTKEPWVIFERDTEFITKLFSKY